MGFYTIALLTGLTCSDKVRARGIEDHHVRSTFFCSNLMAWQLIGLITDGTLLRQELIKIMGDNKVVMVLKIQAASPGGGSIGPLANRGGDRGLQLTRGV